MEQSEAFDVAVVFPKSNSEHSVKRKSSYFIVALECFIRVCSCFVCCRHVPDCLKHLSRVGEKKTNSCLHVAAIQTLVVFIDVLSVVAETDAFI